MPKIAIIPGSSRAQSFNTRVATAIGHKLGQMGAEIQLISLADYPMPIYDGDMEAEQGCASQAIALAAVLAQCQGVVLVHPEYNSSITPLMKNMLDWMSRDVGVEVYQNRTFALAAGSPGALGGIRVLSHARDVLVSVGADTITPQLCVGGGDSAFAPDGTLANERHQKLLHTMCETLIRRAKTH